ncbi:MAG: hypothetical protein HYY17_04675 [Planctomycetes bacterium]|nr:hypothetical protein [Planctomycetota bacterium]
MEATVFPRPEVRQELDKFAYVKLYVDKPEPEGSRNKKLRDGRFKSNDLPLYLVLDENGEELARLNFAERDPRKFLAFLREGIEAAETTASR